MDLRQLEYFVAVAEEASFTRAAHRVRISQSGVSAQISRLERELGAILIDRSGRSATLTPAGKAALEHVRATLASAQSVRQAVGEVSQLIRGRLLVGMVTACTVTGLFDALSAFHLAHPGVEITLIEDSSDRLTEQVRAGVLDLALIGAAESTPPGLEALPIVSERLVACVPADHPLAKQPRVRLAEVTAYPVVCMPTGTGIRAVFDRACATRGLRPTVSLQASAPATVADLASRGLGVAVLSESMATGYRDRLHSAIVEDVDLPAVLALIWRSPTGPALRELLAHGRRAFAGPATARRGPARSRT